MQRESQLRVYLMRCCPRYLGWSTSTGAGRSETHSHVYAHVYFMPAHTSMHVSFHICTHMSVCISIHVSTPHVHTYVHAHVHTHVDAHVHTHVNTHVHTHVHTQVFRIFIHTSIHMPMPMSVPMSVQMSIHISTCLPQVGLQELIEFLKHGKCVPLKKTVPKKGKEASPVVPPADRKDVTVGLEPACQVQQQSVQQSEQWSAQQSLQQPAAMALATVCGTSQVHQLVSHCCPILCPRDSPNVSKMSVRLGPALALDVCVPGRARGSEAPAR